MSLLLHILNQEKERREEFGVLPSLLIIYARHVSLTYHPEYIHGYLLNQGTARFIE